MVLISYTDDVQLRGVEVQNLSKEWEQRIVVIEESIKIFRIILLEKLTPEANELIGTGFKFMGSIALIWTVCRDRMKKLQRWNTLPS